MLRSHLCPPHPLTPPAAEYAISVHVKITAPRPDLSLKVTPWLISQTELNAILLFEPLGAHLVTFTNAGAEVWLDLRPRYDHTVFLLVNAFLTSFRSL